MKKIKFDATMAGDFVATKEIDALKGMIQEAAKTLVEGTGEGREYTGWVDLPEQYDKEEVERITRAAEKIRKDSQVFVVVGIGGSYLGAKAALDFLQHPYYNLLPAEKRQGPEIYFAGNQLSATSLSGLLDIIGDRDFSINVISKSGTTTEPAIAFRLLREKLEKKYGRKGAAERIYATTDRKVGALKTMADTEGYERFVVPDEIGGRYSVLTAVGLLPIAVSGASISGLLKGAAKARQEALTADFEDNQALLYVAYRNVLLRKGKQIEMLTNYEPGLHSLAEWWKQLFGESEGKNQKGIFPAAADLTTDLHSMGQYMQDGARILFETVLAVEKPRQELTLRMAEDNLDGLNYLAGRTLSEVNNCAMEGTILAHVKGQVPNLRITLPDMEEESLGQLFYFFEYACGVSGYLLGVNPFDQPGVEQYKSNMFALLGKPGYELKK